MSTLSQFFGGSPIKSIQRGTVSISGAGGATNATATISSVDTTKSMVNLLGATSNSSGASTAQIQHVAAFIGTIALSNSSTIAVSRSNSSTSSSYNVSYEVIEFN